MQEIMQDNKLIIPVELIGKFYRENREEAVRFLSTAADFLHRNPEAFGEQSAPYVDFLYSLWITNVIERPSTASRSRSSPDTMSGSLTSTATEAACWILRSSMPGSGSSS